MADIWVVTGGIGSGKSTIRETLEDLGAVTFDADELGHAVLEPDGPAFAGVVARWPQVAVNGSIDRRALAEIVFGDTEELRELEKLTHPAIAELATRRVEEAGERTVVIEISVPTDLVGAGRERTIVADLPMEVRRMRLRARGMDPADIERRMASQPDRQTWKGRGAWVVSTAGTKDEVAARVRRLWRQITGDQG